MRTDFNSNLNSPSRTASSALRIASFPRCKNVIALIGCHMIGTVEKIKSSRYLSSDTTATDIQLQP